MEIVYYFQLFKEYLKKLQATQKDNQMNTNKINKLENLKKKDQCSCDNLDSYSHDRNKLVAYYHRIH